jgi:hypothetical protein
MPDEKEPIEVKLTFRVPQRMPTVYAHHMMVQPGEHEVLLSFFEVIPPPNFAQDEGQLKKLKEIGIVAECVARITIAKDRFPSFAKAMHDILKAVETPSSEEMTQTDANNKTDNPEG